MKPFNLADALQWSSTNAYAALHCDNSREGGEGIPNQFDQSQMKFGARTCEMFRIERTP